MDNLVLANLAARPIRSLTSIIGIALGVILILVTVGLARGMLLSSGEREGNLRAELVFLPPSGFGAGISTSPLTLPIAYAEAIAEMPGVAATAPVGRTLAMESPQADGNTKTSWLASCLFTGNSPLLPLKDQFPRKIFNPSG